MFPLSSDRMFFMADNNLTKFWHNETIIGFEQELMAVPRYSADKHFIRYHIKKMYEDDVKLFNAITFDGAEKGVVFRNKEAVSIGKYPEIYDRWRTK